MTYIVVEKGEIGEQKEFAVFNRRTEEVYQIFAFKETAQSIARKLNGEIEDDDDQY